MSVRVRPHTTFAAALMAAGVATAASVATLPAHPTISLDVANASVLTDALSSLGKGVEVLSSTVGIHVDATISLPFEASLAVLAATQHPELGPNVLSYLVQRFVNPAVGTPITAYPWETEQTVALLASLLPHPLGPSATDPGAILQAAKAFADVFNGVLGQLPDPMPGFDAVRNVLDDGAVGGAVVAGQLAVRAPLYMAWNTVNYLGNLPVNVEASLESALQTPERIPGLVSNLVYGLLSPDASVGLFGQLLNNVVDPLTWLPAPIGYGSATVAGLANQVRAVIVDVMNRALALLPPPVTPSALPTATAAQSQPIYSVDAGKGAVTPVVQEAKKSTEPTVSTVDRVAAAEGEASVSKTDPADGRAVEVAATPSKKAEPAEAEVKEAEVKDDVKPAKTEPAKPEPAKSEPAKAEPAAAKPAKADESDAA